MNKIKPLISNSALLKPFIGFLERSKRLKKIHLSLILFFVITSVISQTSTEVKSYFNRTNIAVYKAQKEVLSHPELKLDSEFREILVSQLSAKALFENNDLTSSLGFSMLSRSKCIDLFSKLKLANYSFYLETEAEKIVTKNIDLNSFLATQHKDDTEFVKKAADTDIKNPGAVYSLISNIK